jgi:hypothetical protein
MSIMEDANTTTRFPSKAAKVGKRRTMDDTENGRSGAESDEESESNTVELGSDSGSEDTEDLVKKMKPKDREVQVRKRRKKTVCHPLTGWC